MSNCTVALLSAFKSEDMIFLLCYVNNWKDAKKTLEYSLYVHTSRNKGLQAFLEDVNSFSTHGHGDRYQGFLYLHLNF